MLLLCCKYIINMHNDNNLEGEQLTTILMLMIFYRQSTIIPILLQTMEHKTFSYKDMKNVHTIVLFENSNSNLISPIDSRLYFHVGTTRFNTQIDFPLLQHFHMIYQEMENNLKKEIQEKQKILDSQK